VFGDDARSGESIAGDDVYSVTCRFFESIDEDVRLRDGRRWYWVHSFVLLIPSLKWCREEWWRWQRRSLHSRPCRRRLPPLLHCISKVIPWHNLPHNSHTSRLIVVVLEDEPHPSIPRVRPSYFFIAQITCRSKPIRIIQLL